MNVNNCGITEPKLDRLQEHQQETTGLPKLLKGTTHNSLERSGFKAMTLVSTSVLDDTQGRNDRPPRRLLNAGGGGEGSRGPLPLGKGNFSTRP